MPDILYRYRKLLKLLLLTEVFCFNTCLSLTVLKKKRFYWSDIRKKECQKICSRMILRLWRFGWEWRAVFKKKSSFRENKSEMCIFSSMDDCAMLPKEPTGYKAYIFGRFFDCEKSSDVVDHALIFKRRAVGTVFYFYFFQHNEWTRGLMFCDIKIVWCGLVFLRLFGYKICFFQLPRIRKYLLTRTLRNALMKRLYC